VPFGLTYVFLGALYKAQKEKCHWLNLSLLPNTGIHPMRPTIDRLVPKLGYVCTNVVWASQLANYGRSNYPAEQFKKFIADNDLRAK
jgi:hypothetical protein